MQTLFLFETLYKNLLVIYMGETLETEGTLGSLELELQATVSHHVGIRSQILVCR